MRATKESSGRSGSGGCRAFGIILAIFVLIFMGDMAYIYFSEECMGDEDFLDCIAEMMEEEEEQEGSVTATGVISGEFKGTQRSITLSVTFPLEGGSVTGEFSGDCDGSIKGSFAGGNGGVITGNAAGSCAFIFPASGNFSGTVNTASKTVPVHGNGSAAGVSKEGSLTLAY